ncbi:MAG TPA: hypothetical protein VIX59_14740 [Candidatus Binataceae bacterium]
MFARYFSGYDRLRIQTLERAGDRSSESFLRIYLRIHIPLGCFFALMLAAGLTVWFEHAELRELHDRQ